MHCQKQIPFRDPAYRVNVEITTRRASEVFADVAATSIPFAARPPASPDDLVCLPIKPVLINDNTRTSQEFLLNPAPTIAMAPKLHKTTKLLAFSITNWSAMTAEEREVLRYYFNVIEYVIFADRKADWKSIMHDFHDAPAFRRAVAELFFSTKDLTGSHVAALLNYRVGKNRINDYLNQLKYKPNSGEAGGAHETESRPVTNKDDSENIAADDLEIHDRSQPRQRITSLAQGEIPSTNIEKARLRRHRNLAAVPDSDQESSTTLNRQGFSRLPAVSEFEKEIAAYQDWWSKVADEKEIRVSLHELAVWHDLLPERDQWRATIRTFFEKFLGQEKQEMTYERFESGVDKLIRRASQQGRRSELVSGGEEGK